MKHWKECTVSSLKFCHEYRYRRLLSCNFLNITFTKQIKYWEKVWIRKNYWYLTMKDTYVTVIATAYTWTVHPLPRDREYTEHVLHHSYTCLGYNSIGHDPLLHSSCCLLALHVCLTSPCSKEFLFFFNEAVSRLRTLYSLLVT